MCIRDRSDTAQVDSASVAPLPGSQKIYVEGSRPDIRVPMREISLTDTQTEKGPEKNASIRVYDTSGPYTDPAVSIDVRKGLPDVRSQWILERNDTELLDSSSSTYTQERLDDTSLAHLRFRHLRVPRRAKAGCNVSQMHYAKKGIITPEMEYIAIRENMKRAQLAEAKTLDYQHAGQSFGASIPEEITPEFVLSLIHISEPTRPY